MFNKLSGRDISELEVEQLFRGILDPEVFSIKDSSLATVAKLSRDFNEVLEGEFQEKKFSKVLIRRSVINITVDTKKQKESFLIANFGIDAECTDMVPYQGMEGRQLLDMLSNAKKELLTFTPPIPTLQCSYREFSKAGRRMLTKVNFQLNT